jgi:glycosyltransferase involved in cell wall biosynthesis
LISSKGFEKSIKETGWYSGRIDYFPNWIELEYFTPDSNTREVNLPKLPEGFRVMFAGNIGAAQDFPTILSAAERLKNCPDIQWIILGDGRQASWVCEQVKIRNLERNFHLLGKFPSHTMRTFFAQADVLLVTLKRAPIFALTVPGKVQSYMASGRPIVAAMDGEGAQIIEQAGAGLSCPAEDPEALVERILKIYAMAPKERDAMAERGRSYSKVHFNREKLFIWLENEMQDAVQPERKK